MAYSYDGLDRLTKTSLSTIRPIDTTYTYYNSKRGDGYTTTKIETETIDGVTYKYIYDTLGNITNIQKKNGTAYKDLYYYEYDAMNQLVYEKDFEKSQIHEYLYDTGGNIVVEYIHDVGTNGIPTNTKQIRYQYDDSNWTDKLTSYNGQAITYDSIGNPLTYRDGMTMTWQNGRQLASLKKGSNNISYSYDSNNIRISKTVNGVKYTYEYLNGMLLYETRGESKFYYSYDTSGILYSVKYTLTDSSELLTYYFTHNSRGDIIGIYNGEGTLKAQYEYDAWGNVTSITDGNGNAITSATHIGNLNPFRYRGYYYDSETGLYYLMSRYYDPVTHRFINADDSDVIVLSQDLNDKNLFAYTDNNPIICIDDGGECWHIAIGAVIGAIVNVTSTIITNVASGKDWTDDIGIAALSGAASGALSATGVGIVGSIVGNAAIGGFSSAASQIKNNKGFDNFNWGEVASETVMGGISGAIGKAGYGSKHLNKASKQLTKRTVNAVKNNGLKSSAVREIKKAGINYVKNTKKIVTSGVKKGILKPAIYTTPIKTIKITVNHFLGHCGHA